MDLKKLNHLLKDFDLEKRRKYISQEFQAYGLDLASELNDWKNRSLYIRLAKQNPRRILDQARYFVKDQSRGTVKSKARLFMWKLKQLREEEKEKAKGKKPPGKRRQKQPLKH